MKEFKNVRGSMEEVPLIEISVDTVYIRTNVKRVDEVTDDGFHGWEYDEIQYTLLEYLENVNELGQHLTDLELRLMTLEMGV